MKENKGITLVSLVVTIVVLLILATIGTNVGKSVIKDAKYHNTISQMKVMQIKVNELYEKYKDGDVSTVETGEEIPASLIAKATQSFQTAKANNRTEKYIGEDLTGYRYLSSDYIKNSLGVEKSELDYIVNVEYRTVILLDGVKKDGNTYYSLNEIEDEQFNVEYINPTVVLSKNGGTYTIPTNGSISIENILTIVDKPKDTTNITLKLEYAWTTSKETVPTSGWQQAQDGGTIQLDNIRDEGEYYLWTKITNSNLSSITNIENIQTSKPFIVKQASINTYVQYAVVHKQMNLDGTTYTTYETENLRGTEYDTVTPTPKTYTGFTFDEQNSDQNVEINPDGTTSIEYKYTRNRYNLTLGSIEGITLQGSSSPGEYYYGTPINLNATENPGYTFASWQSSDLILLASSNNQQYTFLMPAGNITLTPSISANEYQVAFDSNGGNAVTPSSKSVTYNSIYGELPIPTRVGYTFDGWTGKNLFNIENIVTDAYVNKSGVETQYLTGGARPWSCSDYIEIQGGKTYTFNPNSTNGNGNPSHCIYDENKNFIAAVDSGLQTIVMPQNAKYLRVSFRSTSATAEPSSNIQLEEGSIATEYEPYQIITSSTNVTKTSDHTLYAKWAGNNYTISYDYNGGINSSLIQGKWDAGNSQNTSTTLVDLSGNNKNGTITNTTLDNGYLKFNGTSSEVRLGVIHSDYMTIEVTFSVDNLNNKSQEIMADVQTGGLGIFISSSNCIAGMAYIDGSYRYVYSDIVPEIEKKYHAILSYDGVTEKLIVNGELTEELQINGTIKKPGSSTVMALGFNPVGANSTDGAYFNGKIYNAAIYTNTKDSKTVTQGKSIGELVTPTREGYTFDGWYLGNTEIESSYIFTNAEDIRLVANWVPYTYTIKYNADDGATGSMNDTTATFDQEFKLPIKSFEKDDFTYFEWNTRADKTGITYDDQESVINLSTANNGIVNLYTKFGYRIIYNLDDGNVAINNPKYHDLNTGTFTLNNPTKIGYDFIGWTGSNGETPETTVTVPAGMTGDLEYTANYNSHKLYIQLNVNGGSMKSAHGSDYSINEDGFLINSSSGEIFKHIVGYGEKLTSNGLLNYNNSKALNIEKTGYKINESTVWNTEADGSGKNYNQTSPYAASAFADLTQGDVTVTLYANWIKCESTFLPGQQVNGKMKQLAGDSSATYESVDTAITSIVRSNTIQDQYKTDSYIVSTNDSITPIYMWFDNETIYYYTEDDKPSLNEDSSYLFRGLRSAESIELTDFDTSNVITMQRAFYNCMSLTSLDLSSFNMNKVTSVDNMLYGMTSLIELKTPKVYPTGAAVTISLPKTLYDSSQNSYTSLSNGSPIETWLKLEYENASNINNNQQVTTSSISPTQSNSFSGLVSEAKSRKIFIIIAIAVFLSVGVLLRNRRKKQDK